jgi:hypothetical protein
MTEYLKPVLLTAAAVAIVLIVRDNLPKGSFSFKKA